VAPQAGLQHLKQKKAVEKEEEEERLAQPNSAHTKGEAGARSR
jgi:hypothetical protein